jgi:hypothetical protein
MVMTGNEKYWKTNCPECEHIWKMSTAIAFLPGIVTCKNVN